LREVFNRIYIKEDIDLREIKSGELPKLFLDSIIDSQFPNGDVQIIINEVEALDLETVQTGILSQTRMQY